MDVCSLATGHVDSSATTAMAPLSTHPKSLASLTHIAGVYSPWWVKIQIIKFKLRADNLLYFLRYRELILRPLPLNSSDILKCPSNNIIGFRLPLMQSIQVSSLLTSFLQSTSIYSKYIKSFSHRSAHKRAKLAIRQMAKSTDWLDLATSQALRCCCLMKSCDTFHHVRKKHYHFANDVLGRCSRQRVKSKYSLFSYLLPKVGHQHLRATVLAA